MANSNPRKNKAFYVGTSVTKIVNIISETSDTITIQFHPLSEEKIIFLPGQFITLIFDKQGKQVRRSYSLSSAPGIDPHLSITLKRIINGEISRFLFENIKVGDILKALPPTGRFTVTPKKDLKRHFFLIAAGSGISPLFSIIRSVLLNEPFSRLTLVYSNRNEQTTIFYNALLELEKGYRGRFKCHFIFSESIHKSYLNTSHLNTDLLEGLIKGNHPNDTEKVDFYICGPFAFMRMAEIKIISMGFGHEYIHKENFVILAEQEAINTPPLIKDTSEKQVSISYKGATYNFVVPPETTILKAAYENGIEIPYSCKAGICATCAAICEKGEVKMSINQVLTNKDLKHGWTLPCVGYPATHETVLRFD